MGDKTRILILGGGYGGVWAGKKLEKHYRKREDVEITLVDRKPFHTLMTELHEVAGWRTDPESVQVSFRKIFGARRIKCVVDTIESVDFEGKTAKSRSRDYPFDYIVLGTGAQPEYFGTPGVEENCLPLWSFDDAIRIRHHLETTITKAMEECDQAKRRQLLTFVVAGAGFTGIEMAGELIELRDQVCAKHLIDPSEIRILVIEALPTILPIFEEALRKKTEEYLRDKGCELMVATPIIGAEPGKVLVKGAQPIETATFIWTCGVKGTEFGAALGLPMAKKNRIETDEGLRSTKYPFAFAVGDNAGLMVEGKPMAMIVESAHFSAEAAVGNIVSAIDGGEAHTFRPNYHGFMVSIGGRFGVANAGGMRTSGFFAMTIKHVINMFYLFRIAGLNQVWEYFSHEFLDMKDRRSIVGGFVSYKVRSYWLLLLRAWLGLSWIFEGMNKIGDGWLRYSVGSRSGWMFSQGVVQAGVKAATDATSAASAAGDAAGAAGAAAATAAAGAVAATSAASAATGTAAAATAAAGAVAATSAASGAETAATAVAGGASPFHPIWDMTQNILDPKSGLVRWFKTTFMDGILSYLPYQLFQTVVVCTEMGVGLLLLGGFFTWFGGVASIVLTLVFTLSGMFRWDQAWFFFAGILMMGGAGRAFGIDYWTVPLFKKWWNGTRLARNTHLYTGDPTK